MGYVHRSCNNSIRDEYRAPAWVDKVSNTVKGPIHNTVGETGKFEKSGIPRGMSTSGSDMDDYGYTIKSGFGG